MGELTKIRCTLDGDPNIEFMNQIVQFVEDERNRGRTDPDPLIMVRAIFAAHKTLMILVENGYLQLQPVLQEMLIGVEEIARMFRRELCRRLLTDDQIDEARAAAAVAELARWPDWQAMLAEADGDLQSA